MKYIKELIPQEHRVNLTQYQSDINKMSINHQNALVPIIAIILSLIAIICLKSRFVISMILLFVAVCLYHKTSNLIEDFFRFSFTKKIKNYLFCSLFLISIPFNIHYINSEKVALASQKAQDEKEAIVQKIKQEQEIKQQKERQLQEQILLKEAEHFKKLGNIELTQRNYKKALVYFDKCEKSNAGIIVNYQKGLCLMGLSNYDSAIVVFSAPISDSSFIQIGKCYEKQNLKADALRYYKLAGTEEGEKLYNKLNPIRRRVLYYQTMCCDGSPSPSNAKGRGACSHHGGVCDWNQPVYEEYREFENQ